MSSTSATESPSTIVQRLGDLKPASPQFNELLKTVLYGRNYADFGSSLKGHEALAFIDILDSALENMQPDSDLYRKGLRALRKICGQTRLLPTTHMLADGLEKSGDMPAASGGFADVWRGTYNGRQVAIKALRIYNTDDLQQVKKLFCKEVVVWRRLSHANVLPFLGVSTAVFRLSMVSEWMSNGNISHYVTTHPEANRLELLIDVASGLQFLHMAQVVHGDLKGPNILINDSGRACLADFGLASITSDPLSVNASTSGATHGSARWMAPELLNPEHPDQDVNRPTEASDIWALAMVMVEVLGGHVPFHEFRNEVVIFKVMAGVRPERPTNAAMTDEIWEMVHSCWNEDPTKRPKISEVLDCLQRTAHPDEYRTTTVFARALVPEPTVIEKKPSSGPIAQPRAAAPQSQKPKARQISEKPNSPGLMDRILKMFGCVPSTR